jgi:hypothetical protein
MKIYPKLIVVFALCLLLANTSITSAGPLRQVVPVELDNPQDIAVDRIPSRGFIYLTEAGNDRIWIFPPFVGSVQSWQVGEPGNGIGQFQEPSGIAVDSDGFIYVADTGNNRIQRVDRAINKDIDDEIEVIGVLETPGSPLNAPHGLGIDSADRIYIADTGNSRVVVTGGGLVIGGPGDEPGTFDEPIDVAVCRTNGWIYVLDRGRNRVQIFDSLDNGAAWLDSFGRPGDGLGSFNSPSGIDVDINCIVYVADTGNNRIQRFTKEGGGIGESVLGLGSRAPNGIAVGGTCPDCGVYATFDGSSTGQPDGLEEFGWIVYDTTGDGDPDSDGDGLPDLWETEGIDFNTDGAIDLDLPVLGANALRKDVFVEFDFMETQEPSLEELEPVIQAFADAPVNNPDGSTGITLHIEIDEEVEFIQRIILWPEFDAIKAEHFGTGAQRSAPNANDLLTAKALVYRYAINAFQICGGVDENDPTECIDYSHRGGYSDFGPNFVVAIGDNDDVFDLAGAFMHELGHSLGLRHGGHDKVNCKPNYLSIMNYLYEEAGLEDTQTNQTVLDYSRQALPTLVEGPRLDDEQDGLVEGDGVGDGTFRIFWSYAPYSVSHGPGDGPLDWNQNRDIDPGFVEVDLNAYPISGCGLDQPVYPNYEVLEGHDDWANLDYVFSNNPGFYEGAHLAFEIPDELTAEDARTLKRCIETGFCYPPKYEYAAKLVCGVQKDPQDLRLVPGFYASSINVHNPHLQNANFFVKVALTFPPEEIAPGEVIPDQVYQLAYDEALAVDCTTLKREVFDGEFPGSYIEGFAIIQSESSLDVDGVYSVASVDKEGYPIGPSDLEIVAIEERVRDDSTDLEVTKQAEILGAPDSINAVLYSVAVTNKGPSRAENITLTDSLRVELGSLLGVLEDQFSASKGSGWSVVDQDQSGSTLMATIPELDVGETADLEFVVRVRVDRQELRWAMINDVVVESDTQDIAPQNNLDTVETVVELP